MPTKGIVLAGGNGTRLYPSTKSISKQLLPVYDKPTIYYPISILMLAGIRDIMIISTPRDLPFLKDLLNDGSELGVKFHYKVQPKPEGIAQAFLIADDFIKGHPCCLILGDNLFFGNEIPKMLDHTIKHNPGATVFAYRVQDPERYGVVEFDDKGKGISLEEKPKNPKSHWAVTGLYFYDENVLEYTKGLKPSARGELEITDLNKVYLKKGTLQVEVFGRGIAWLDTGTHESLLASSQFVQTIEARQGLKIACLEEIALFKGFITQKQFDEIARKYPDSSYGKYLRSLAKE
jgi:glucose-1-phosphate thymidylyltransferase